MEGKLHSFCCMLISKKKTFARRSCAFPPSMCTHKTIGTIIQLMSALHFLVFWSQIALEKFIPVNFIILLFLCNSANLEEEIMLCRHPPPPPIGLQTVKVRKIETVWESFRWSLLAILGMGIMWRRCVMWYRLIVVACGSHEFYAYVNWLFALPHL